MMLVFAAVASAEPKVDSSQRLRGAARYGRLDGRLGRRAGLNYMVAEVSTDGNNSTTEDTLFLDPANCDHNVNGTWHRADFTGFHVDASCKIVVNSPETATYSSDATHSAFANYAAANPGAIVIHRYVVIAKAGDSRFDRIALGVGKMYVSASTRAQNCTSEASC